MENTVYVRMTSVYGKQTFYPVCEKAVIFAQLSGTKTLTQAALNNILKLGFKLEVEQPKITFS